MKQQSLFKKEKLDFGGSLSLNKRKERRPFSIKAPIFVTLKIDVSVQLPLYKNRKALLDELKHWAQQFKIELFEVAICGNHMHFGLRAFSYEDYKRFIRTFTGQTAKKLKIKWASRPHTRVVSWGKAFEVMNQYIIQNHQETVGIRPYKTRKVS